MNLTRLPGTPTLFYTTDAPEEHRNILEDSESNILLTPDVILDYVLKVQLNVMPAHTLQIKLGGTYQLL